MTFHNISIRLAVLVIAATFCFPIQAELSQTDADKRAGALKAAGTPSDSLTILLDVLDLSDSVNRGRVKKQILDVAKRAKNEEVLTEVITELSSATDDAVELSKLIEISEGITEEGKKRSAATVLNMEKAKAEVLDITDENRRQKILDSSLGGMSLTNNRYEEIENLYRALVILGASSQGPMYHEYITRLEELVKGLPEDDYAIKNLFYTTAALYYTRKRDYKKAIECDREMIKQLNAMSSRYDEEGRQSHNLDYFYYVSYRRMLRNFMGLTPEEIEEYYAKCQELAEKDKKVQEAFGNGGLTKSYYFVATGRFKEAVPELRKALASEDISKFRRQELLGLLAWSLRETGDSKAELETLREYTTMVIEDMDERRENTYKEIKLRNNVTQLMAEQIKEQEQQREDNRRMRKTALTLVYVLAVILIFLCRAYMKLRQKVKELENRNKKLRTNIEHIFDDGSPSGTTDLRHQKNRLKG